jgi:6-phosphogluconolactonase
MTRLADAAREIVADRGALARRAARWLCVAAAAKDGPFAVCLSGGSTPRPVYALLAAPPYRDAFPWPRVHWFWGDERFVPPDDARSNFGMVRAALLSRAPVPDANIHAIATAGASPAAATAAYEGVLRSFYGATRLDRARPLFDVTFLGLGADGHTASLFPGDAALAERERWVAAVPGAPSAARITLTFPALESSRATAFLVAGADKRAILARLMRGAEDVPAARLDPAGTVRLFADAAAWGTGA